MSERHKQVALTYLLVDQKDYHAQIERSDFKSRSFIILANLRVTGEPKMYRKTWQAISLTLS